MAENSSPEERLIREPGEGGIGIPFPRPPFPRPVPPPPIPPFQPASYTFRLVSMQVLNTRSAHLDSDKASLTVGVGPNPQPVTVTKDLGDVNNGTFQIGLSIGPIQISDPNIGIAMNYLILNSGHKSHDEVNKILTGTGDSLAAAGAKAATSAVGSAVGAALGTSIVPVLGTALGALAGWLVGQVTGLLTADCDGPVASEQAAFKGQQLWNYTAHGAYTHTTYHPGIDSASGCGSNSIYTATWSISR
jgi:hypothetical protein